MKSKRHRHQRGMKAKKRGWGEWQKEMVMLLSLTLSLPPSHSYSLFTNPLELVKWYLSMQERNVKMKTYIEVTVLYCSTTLLARLLSYWDNLTMIRSYGTNNQQLLSFSLLRILYVMYLLRFAEVMRKKVLLYILSSHIPARISLEPQDLGPHSR